MLNRSGDAAAQGHTSLHVLDKVLGILDGGFRLYNGISNYFLLRRVILSRPRLFHRPIFPQQQGPEDVGAYRLFELKERTLNNFFLLVHGIHQGKDKVCLHHKPQIG